MGIKTCFQERPRPSPTPRFNSAQRPLNQTLVHAPAHSTDGHGESHALPTPARCPTLGQAGSPHLTRGDWATLPVEVNFHLPKAAALRVSKGWPPGHPQSLRTAPLAPGSPNEGPDSAKTTDGLPPPVKLLD